MVAVICVMKVIMFRYSKIQAEEMLRFGLVKVYWKCVTNHCDHSKTAFILGVPSTKGRPERLLSVEDSAEPVFLSEMVRKVTVVSCNSRLRGQHFSQEVVASVKA